MGCKDVVLPQKFVDTLQKKLPSVWRADKTVIYEKLVVSCKEIKQWKRTSIFLEFAQQKNERTQQAISSKESTWSIFPVVEDLFC